MPDVRPVWREAFRVLRPGGVFLAGFCNPALYVFDDARAERGELVVRHAVRPRRTDPDRRALLRLAALGAGATIATAAWDNGGATARRFTWS